MAVNISIRRLALCLVLLMQFATMPPATAQVPVGQNAAIADTLDMEEVPAVNLGDFDEMLTDSLLTDTISFGPSPVTLTGKRAKRDWSTWKPSPKRAMWLAIVLPGAGQIYNRKYWKLPIVYGGFVGCIYALQWNNQMYRDYSQAFIDISDNDPTTQSYNQFLHLGQKIDSGNEERFKALFKKRKDYYRRYRDLSFFVLLGVYALSVIDAYVDASLSDFDISKDLSMKVSPAIIHDSTVRSPLKSNALGLQCSLTF